MSEYTIWWIDDSPDRKENGADRIEEHVEELSTEFNEPEDAIDRLDNGEDLAGIDLVLIDWKLNEDGGFFGKGLTMAGKVREELTDIPVYGFSSDTVENKEEFEATYPFSDLHTKNGAEDLKADLEAYESVRSVRGEGLRDLIETLSPPEDTIADLESAIPREYVNGLRPDPQSDGGSVVEFVDWVRTRFLDTPGPLWNDAWTATKIGLKEEILGDYAEDLNDTKHGKAIYEGIFSHRKSRLWWSSSVIDAVVTISQEKEIDIGELKTVGENVLGESEVPKCRVCGEELPDILAAGKNGEDATNPVHLGCSHIHHSREGPFEDYRVANDL